MQRQILSNVWRKKKKKIYIFFSPNVTFITRYGWTHPGMLHWIIELGRIDVQYETSVLSQYLANPREGHLNQALNIISYLLRHMSSWIISDPRKIQVKWISDGSLCPAERARALRDQYTDAVERIPFNMPNPRVSRSRSISLLMWTMPEIE